MGDFGDKLSGLPGVCGRRRLGFVLVPVADCAWVVAGAEVCGAVASCWKGSVVLGAMSIDAHGLIERVA